jgi:hypothetical protein
MSLFTGFSIQDILLLKYSSTLNPPKLNDADIRNEKTQSGAIDNIPSQDKKQLGQYSNIKMVAIPKFNKKNLLAELNIVAERKKSLLIFFS